jgi:hypothetical protein
MQRRWRRDRHLRRRLCVGRDEAPMRDHRVAGKGAEPDLEPQQDRPRLRSLELELALAAIGFHPFERHQEVGLPRGAAIFAVGDGGETHVLLAPDQRDDLAILDGLQCGGVDLAPLAPQARFPERRAAQQAADVIGAERRDGALHDGMFIACSEGNVRARLPTRGEERRVAPCRNRSTAKPISPPALAHC